MAMLDEEEFQLILQPLRGKPSELIMAPLSDGHPVMTTALQRFLDEYNRITGQGETNPNAIWHHRIALYGPPCRACGKPLRSPGARFCAACGSTRAERTLS